MVALAGAFGSKAARLMIRKAAGSRHACPIRAESTIVGDDELADAPRTVIQVHVSVPHDEESAGALECLNEGSILEWSVVVAHLSRDHCFVIALHEGKGADPQIGLDSIALKASSTELTNSSNGSPQACVTKVSSKSPSGLSDIAYDVPVWAHLGLISFSLRSYIVIVENWHPKRALASSRMSSNCAKEMAQCSGAIP